MSRMLAAVSVLAIAAVVFAVVPEGRGHSRRGAATAAALPAPARGRHRLGAIERGRLARAGDAGIVRRLLARTSYVASGGRRVHDVALTFDDGPGPWTARIVHALRRHHASATFFVIGRWARQYPKLVALEVRNGFPVGDHTEDHPPLASLGKRAQHAEIADAARAIQRAGAPRPVLFRPPYGSFDSTTLGILRRAHMLMVLWSADTKDYSRPGVSRVAYAGISGGRAGAIILMHDGGGDRSETLAALPRIVHRLREHGYHLVTLPRLLEDDPPPRHLPPPRPLSGGVG